MDAPGGEEQGKDDNDDDSQLPPPVLLSTINTAMQASHVHGHDNDDDDDNWSRLVETDETVVAGGDESVSMREAMESVIVTEQLQQENQQMMGQHVGDENGHELRGREQATDASGTPLGPHQPELSMKEKLVLRERQRRIETERARLKRQFALNNEHEGHDDDMVAAQAELSEAAIRDNGSSAAGTLGEESTKAHPDEESENQEKLGFNMERFLRNSDSFNPELEPTAEDTAPTAPDKGPVMERFLNAPVVVGETTSEPEPPKSSEPPTISTEVQRSVSFDVMLDTAAADSELGGGDESPVHIANSLPSFNETTPSIDANMSVVVHADEDDVARGDPLIMSMTSMDAQESVLSVEDGAVLSASNSSSNGPRILRLTEADMQEMAAIEEASIGNGPPSERTEEDLSESEIGELADFGSGHNHNNNVHDATADFSQDTPTTAMESASMLSGGNQSAQPVSATSEDHIVDEHSLDGMPSVSVSSQLLGSPGGVSTSANPMSDTARDEQGPGRTAELTHQPILEDDDDSDGANSEGLVNRRLRPGMGNHIRPQTTARSAPTGGPSTTTPHEAPTSPFVVEGFDFDKDEPMSPRTEHNDSLRDLPDDGWSPSAGKMTISPIRRSAASLPPTTEEESAAQNRNYGSMVGEQQQGRSLPGPKIAYAASSNRNDESRPLLGDVPPEITTRRQASQGVSESEGHPSSKRSIPLIPALEGVEAEAEHGTGSDVDEAALYDSSSTLKRGKHFPLFVVGAGCNLGFRLLTLYSFSLSGSLACALRDTNR
jgi:hypothetical protein